MRWLDVDGHEFKKAPGAGDEQGGLACCAFLGRKESDTTEQLNWIELPLVVGILHTYKVLCIVEPFFPFREDPLTTLYVGSVSVEFSPSVVSDCLQPHGLQYARLPVHQQLPTLAKFKLRSIKSVMPSNHLILYHPLLLLPSIFPSIRVFSSESVLRIRWQKHWRFSFSISPSCE